MDINAAREFLLKIMSVDSTSGQEEKLADYLIDNNFFPSAKLEIQPHHINKKNLFYTWGTPKTIFCTHLDTVPPYIPPRHEDEVIYGRGANDAKGQITAIIAAVNQLIAEKQNDFGVLLVAGEEVESYGAIHANEKISGSNYLIVCEPTENKLIEAGKGSILAQIDIKGKSSHSGYPHHGDDAIDRMRVFLNHLASFKFPIDPILGQTTHNVGFLNAPNAFNVVPDKVSMKVFFRTTPKTHDLIKSMLIAMADGNISINILSTNAPIKFHTVEGFQKDVVAYVCDAPKLNRLGKPLMYGPGSILNAHTKDEHLKIADLELAIVDLKKIFYKLKLEETT